MDVRRKLHQRVILPVAPTVMTGLVIFGLFAECLLMPGAFNWSVQHLL
jgi:hypothetical protein